MPRPTNWYSSSVFPSFAAPGVLNGASAVTWIMRGKVGIVEVPVGTCSTSFLDTSLRIVDGVGSGGASSLIVFCSALDFGYSATVAMMATVQAAMPYPDKRMRLIFLARSVLPCSAFEGSDFWYLRRSISEEP